MVMAPEAPSLYPELREVEAPQAKGPHGYYRRRSDTDWIITAGAWRSYRSDMEYKGYEFLAKYGTFTNGTFRGKPLEKDARGGPWNPADEPWRLLFQRGGAHEFPVTQIIAYHWHLRPPYREVQFPQLVGVKVTDYRCPECPKEVLFSAVNQREAAEMLRQHLMSQINGRHSYRLADLEELGKMWGIEFGVNRVSVNSPLAGTHAEAQAEEDGVASLGGPPEEPELDFALKCDYCDWAPKKGRQASNAKRMHLWHCKAAKAALPAATAEEPAE